MEYFVELDVTALAGDVSKGMMVQVRGTPILPKNPQRCVTIVLYFFKCLNLPSPQITMAGNISDTSYTTASVPVVEGKARHVFSVSDRYDPL